MLANGASQYGDILELAVLGVAELVQAGLAENMKTGEHARRDEFVGTEAAMVLAGRVAVAVVVHLLQGVDLVSRAEARALVAAVALGTVVLVALDRRLAVVRRSGGGD